MVSDMPTFPCEQLTRLLEDFAQIAPQVFYKPLFACAASSKAVVVAHQLALLAVLSHAVPRLLISDAEMISVALMSETGGNFGKGKGREGAPAAWAKPRLGQLVLLLQLIDRLRSIRLSQKDAQTVRLVH